MSSKLGVGVPRNVSFSFSHRKHHHRHASPIFLSPSIFPYAEKWPPTSTSAFVLPIFLRKNTLQPLPSSTSPSFFPSEEGKKEVEEQVLGEEEGANALSTAREAVRQYLEEEIGVSREESLQISSNSPKYLAMLIHSVQDLDQLSSSSPPLAFWSQSASTASPLSFMDKVWEMARRKGDKGMLPYLESIGLTLSSASHLARYLSPHTLPTLIHQVQTFLVLHYFYAPKLPAPAQIRATCFISEGYEVHCLENTPLEY